MPLAHKPHRPKPEVELLRRRNISFEEAERGLIQALSPAQSSDGGEGILDVPGSYLVSYRNIPEILQSLQKEWVTLSPAKRPRSSFVEVVGRLETHLHPCFLSRLGYGLRGAAGFLLHRYIDRLDCIPLGFMELKPASSYAAVVAESPYVHFLVQFKAIGFAPRKGDWLLGTIGKQQVKAGLNVTVLGLWNVHVRQHNLPKHFEWCNDTWINRAGQGKEEAGPSNEKIWLQLTETLRADKTLRSGSSIAPDFRCLIGEPPRIHVDKSNSQDVTLHSNENGVADKKKRKGSIVDSAAVMKAAVKPEGAVESANSSDRRKGTRAKQEQAAASTPDSEKKKRKRNATT